MCVIVHDTVGGLLTEKEFEDYQMRNSDGFGILPLNTTESVPIKVWGNEEEEKRAWKEYSKMPHVMHLRLRTHGKIDEKNTHPYPIGETGHYLFHNGIITETADLISKECSDTWHLSKLFLEPLLRDDFDWSDPFCVMLGKFITGSKLVIVKPDRSTVTINKSKGEILRQGLWVSNTYGLGADDRYWEWAQASTYKPSAKLKSPSAKLSSAVKSFEVWGSAIRPITKSELVSLSLREFSIMCKVKPPQFMAALKEFCGLENDFVENSTELWQKLHEEVFDK